MGDLQNLKTKLCKIGSGHAAYTTVVYAARAELKSILFEGWVANDIASGGQLTITTDVENFPSFPNGILGGELTDRCCKQLESLGTEIFTETVSKVDFSKRPFKVFTDSRTVEADAVIIATDAVAKRLPFYRRRVLYATYRPIFRKKPLAIINNGDSAMEESTFLISS